MAIRYAPATNTTGLPAAAPTSSPATLDAFTKAMNKKLPKPQVAQPVEPSGKRGRPSTGQARKPITVRLDADLVDAMAQIPDWREQINTILRAHFRPNQF